MNKGFIVSIKMLIFILIVVALIAIPVVYVVGDNSKKNAMKNISRRVEDASYRYFIKQIGTQERIVLDMEKDMNKIELSGQKPKGGTVYIETDGRITFAIYNEEWCSIKENSDDTDYKIIRYEEGNCHL